MLLKQTSFSATRINVVERTSPSCSLLFTTSREHKSTDFFRSLALAAAFCLRLLGATDLNADHDELGGTAVQWVPGTGVVVVLLEAVRSLANPRMGCS